MRFDRDPHRAFSIPPFHVSSVMFRSLITWIKGGSWLAVLIFNRLPHEDVPYETWLKDLNEELVLLTSKQYEKEFLNGYSKVFSFENYDFNNAVEFMALKLHEETPYRFVIATAERDILRAAKIREYLGLDGQSWESALAFRDKVKMKRLLSQAGIRVPQYAYLESVIDLYRFIVEHGYPVVVKPVDGMGSRNTEILHSDEDAIRYLEHGLTPGLEVEEFIEGEMYHVDGLVLDGELKLCWPSKYLNHCLAFQDGSYLGSYLLSPTNPLTQRLQHYVSSILNILPTPTHTSFHAEVFHTPQDELILCEIACRTGGSRICEEYRQAFGVDLTGFAVQAQCGLPVKVPERVREGKGPKTQYGFIGIPPKQGVFLRAPEKDELPDWVVEYRLLSEPGKRYDGPHTSVDYSVTLLVKGETEEQVQERLQEMAQYFDQKMQWQLDV